MKNKTANQILLSMGTSFLLLSLVFLTFSGFWTAHLGSLGALSFLALTANKYPVFFRKKWLGKRPPKSDYV